VIRFSLSTSKRWLGSFMAPIYGSHTILRYS
jgi:hypothetical protein